jgi:serine-type D-Ala-D-Ala carboxypeptidase/endopeptidase
MSINLSTYMMILFLITIVLSPTISSSVSASPSTTINNSSTYPISNSSSFTSLITEKEKNNLTSPTTFEITDNLKALIKDKIDSNKSNAAMAIGFIDPNGTQFYGYGKLSNASNNATIDENTVFAIGSNTKVFTTILLADMVNKGLINLDDPIEKYLPSNVSVPQFNGHKITIEDLATHTSGLPEFPDNYCTYFFDLAQSGVPDSVQFRTDVFNCTKEYTFEQFYQALSNFTLTREPGSKVEYSTFGTALLGHILALKSNMSSFDELLKHDMLDVLGMNDTGFVLSDSQKSRLAVGHFNGEELPTLNFSNSIAPGGGLHSTVSDMLKFLSANMGLIKTELDSAMQESHLIRLNSGQVLPNNLQTSEKNSNIGLYVGLGWFITTNYGHEVIWHNGATMGGYNAYMAFNPTTERGIVILCSTDLADINVTTISFSQNDELSSLTWSLLNQ